MPVVEENYSLQINPAFSRKLLDNNHIQLTVLHIHESTHLSDSKQFMPGLTIGVSRVHS